MNPAEHADAWEAGVLALHAEAAGAFKLIAIMIEDVPRLAIAAQQGNADAMSALQAMNDALTRIGTEPAASATLCGACERRFMDHPFSLCVTNAAMADRPKHGLVIGFCDDCASTRQEVLGKAHVALREVWPDARVIDLTHAQGGRA